ncbi:nicotinic acid mononucleotide adenylyltransferase [Bacillus coahuilensis m2-6]|uniref:Probable nicotinate-nucleotide adenylyltransferase n=1 Tax=Bacillus coahuilensis p1.1.43 TaxID=1150625 RepID=A0A147K7S4_9BACI|nr:nicotinate-nucleotide adenylyltransferase [Bacillus coahuilensis]KUP06054.1 nicotinic acid mononucleotide adenylyltransferase [Bacillus coahuilensis p1.1.43]KUP07262.1 nicotinic acid mononucleotide adenylyltransferase [Bacillus coahuilensis m2-6]
MKRIGLLGGTFNPPHIGHLLMATEVMDALSLDEVRFMPNYEPPHKDVVGITATTRYELLKAALWEHPRFHIETIELERKGLSYTVKTLEELTEQESEHKFFFIIGGDSVKSLPTWFQYERLVELVTFVGVNRPHVEVDPVDGVIMVEMPGVDISSTMIRERVKSKKSIRYYVPDRVREYIEREKLYE